MRRTRTYWLGMGSVLLFTVGCGIVSAQEDPTTKTPPNNQSVATDKSHAEIIRLLKTWSDRITNVRMVWESRSYELDGQPHSGKGRFADRWVREWVWCKDGRWRIQNISHLRERLVENEVQIDNGKLFYKAKYATAVTSQDYPYSLEISEAKNSPYSVSPYSMGYATNVPLEGQWLHFRKEWLGEHLDAHGPNVWDKEQVGESLLPRIHLKDEGWSPVFVLDPKFGYQPRIIRHKSEDIFQENRVEEFQELEPGFWFPKSGTYRVESEKYPELNELRRWKVTEAAINLAFNRSDFEILPAEGTEVQDRIASRKFTFGPNMPEGTMENGLNRDVMKWVEDGMPGRHPDFREKVKRAATKKRWTVILLSLLLLIGVIVLVWRVFWQAAQTEAN